MKTLGKFQNGHRITTYTQHYDGYGNKSITVHQTEDVEPVFKRAKILREVKGKDKELRFKASIPRNVWEEACKINALLWGVQKRDVHRELMSGKTDRAQKVLRTLTEGRDFRKFQGV